MATFQNYGLHSGYFHPLLRQWQQYSGGCGDMVWYGNVLRIVQLNRKFFITSSERFPIDAAHIPNR